MFISGIEPAIGISPLCPTLINVVCKQMYGYTRSELYEKCMGILHYYRVQIVQIIRCVSALMVPWKCVPIFMIDGRRLRLVYIIACSVCFRVRLYTSATLYGRSPIDFVKIS